MRAVAAVKFVVHQDSDCILAWKYVPDDEALLRPDNFLLSAPEPEYEIEPKDRWEWLHESVEANKSDAHHLLGKMPGPGLWVFEGDVFLCAGSSSHFDGVCDCGEDYRGKWRRLTALELESLASGVTEHV